LGRAEMVELLPRKGAEANVTDEEGITPLDWAARPERAEAPALLRAHGGRQARDLPIAARRAATNGRKAADRRSGARHVPRKPCLASWAARLGERPDDRTELPATHGTCSVYRCAA
jgi:hypothetical protein